MSTGLVIAIVVIAAVVFGAIVVLTTARSTEVRGAGSLSRETRSRDRKTTIGEDTSTGREVEAAARSTEIVKAAPVEVAPFVAPDEEALGVSRRQFFNRTAVTLMAASIGAFGASVVGFLWKGAEGGFGSKRLLCSQECKLASWRCTRSAHTLVAAFLSVQALSGSNASAMVRSTTALVKRRAVPHLAVWIALLSLSQTETSPSIQVQSSLDLQLV